MNPDDITYVPKHLANRPGRGRPSHAQRMLTDWEAIRRLWESGFSSAEISRRYPVTSRAVQYRGVKWDRAKRDEALAARAAHASYPEGVDLTKLPERKVLVDIDAEAFMGVMTSISEPRWPANMPMHEVSLALEAMTRGLTFTLACEQAGIGAEATKTWRTAEPRLDLLFRKARALAAKALVEKVADAADKDWRAGAWLLERGATKEEWQDQQIQATGLTIEVKVDRGDEVMREAGIKVIDVEPSPEPARAQYQEVKDEDVDPGLHTISQTEGVPRIEGPADPLRGSRRRR